MEETKENSVVEGNERKRETVVEDGRNERKRETVVETPTPLAPLGSIEKIQLLCKLKKTIFPNECCSDMAECRIRTRNILIMIEYPDRLD
jgi:hypothetical protein